MDYEYARQAFEAYLRQYPRDDDRVRLKIVHTYGVVDCSRRIARRLGLSGEDTELAGLIGLLHDIGRFEQLKRFQSFEPDTMDHAAYGVKILFEEGKIRDFVRESDWDAIIRTAIGRHSDFQLGQIADPRTLLHARLIRDADKLDNCRVKLEEPVEVLLGVTPEEAGAQSVTPEVYRCICEEKCILSADRKTRIDYWVSYLGHVFDVNFLPTLQIIREQGYVEKAVARIPCSNPRTRSQMEEIRQILQRYIRRRLEEGSRESGE